MNDEMLFELFARETVRVAAREEAACAPETDEGSFSPAFEARMDALCRRMDRSHRDLVAHGKRRQTILNMAAGSQNRIEGSNKQMKHKRISRRVLIAALIAALVVAGSTVALYATFNTHGDLTKEEAYDQEILSMSYKQIKRSLNKQTDLAVLTDLPYDYLYALGEMKDELTAEQITKDLCSSKNSPVFQLVLLDAAEYMQIEPVASDLLDAAADPDLSEEVRSRYLDFAVKHLDTGDEEVIEAVRAIAKGDSERLASAAVDILAVIDPAYADELTDDALSSISGPLTDANRRKIQDRAYVLKNQSTSVQRQSFIAECDRLLRERTAAGADQKELDCYIFAISSLDAPESVVYLLSGELIGKDIKIYTVTMQTKHLIDMLDAPLTQEHVQCVITSLQIVPIDKVIERAENALTDSNNADFWSSNEALKKQLRETIDQIDPAKTEKSRDLRVEG